MTIRRGLAAVVVCSLLLSVIPAGCVFRRATDALAAISAGESPAGGRRTTLHWDQALAESRESGKPLMLFFTGSDWCQWCIRLEEEVLDTPEFAEWARDNVVAVEVDFPRGTQLPGDQRVINETLQRQYKNSIPGFPSVLFTDADGEVLGRLGYQPGGATPWIAKAQAIIGTPVAPSAP